MVERPRFRARIRPFLIDVAPVTCEDFEAFDKDYQRSSYSREDRSPATLVSLKMAQAYCAWRSEQEGLPNGSYQIPTEYQWEAAVRGSTGQQYPWGAEMDALRCFCGQDKDANALPVMSMPPGRFGLYDMLGNIWEWTQSSFRAHPFSEHVEKGYTSNLYTVKGGCWFTPHDSCRASLRAAFRAPERRGNLGFRCVRNIE